MIESVKQKRLAVGANAIVFIHLKTISLNKEYFSHAIYFIRFWLKLK